METFKNQSDQNLSTIFEGVGYPTTDGLIIDVSGKQVKPPEYYENPQHMNLDTATISGNVYTIYDVTDMDGNDISFTYYSIQFIFQENRVLMVISADPTKTAGGAGDHIQNGTYELTKS